MFSGSWRFTPGRWRIRSCEACSGRSSRNKWTWRFLWRNHWWFTPDLRKKILWSWWRNICPQSILYMYIVSPAQIHWRRLCWSVSPACALVLLELWPSKMHPKFKKWFETRHLSVSCLKPIVLTWHLSPFVAALHILVTCHMWRTKSPVSKGCHEPKSWPRVGRVPGWSMAFETKRCRDLLSFDIFFVYSILRVKSF